ncbi:MAG: hypothetical protein O8C61_10290 [Candidatus Methanoperedens sp.]|nr:hypothetical protein [Candidatus Methanoperedens sp.]
MRKTGRGRRTRKKNLENIMKSAKAQLTGQSSFVISAYARTTRSFPVLMAYTKGVRPFSGEVRNACVVRRVC